MMSLFKKVAVSIALMLLAACGPNESADDNYSTLEGEGVRFAEHLGKVVLINYWAEWCTPCRQEIPELNALQQKYPEQVLVLGVNFDEVVGEKLQLQADKMGIMFTQLTRDPRDLFGAVPSGVLPETLVIDRRGKFQQILLGPQSLESLEHVVAALPEEMAPDE